MKRLTIGCLAVMAFASVPTALTAETVLPKDIRGPFPIMSTPYFEDGRVDY